MIAGSYPTGVGAATNICQKRFACLVVEVPGRVGLWCRCRASASSTSRRRRAIARDAPAWSPSARSRSIRRATCRPRSSRGGGSGCPRTPVCVDGRDRRPDDLVCQLDERGRNGPEVAHPRASSVRAGPPRRSCRSCARAGARGRARTRPEPSRAACARQATELLIALTTGAGAEVVADAEPHEQTDPELHALIVSHPFRTVDSWAPRQGPRARGGASTPRVRQDAGRDRGSTGRVESSVSLWVRDVPFTPSKRRYGPRLRPHPRASRSCSRSSI